MSMQKNEKLTDKVFMKIITFSFILMFVCLASLCSVTWAWFADSANSSSNTIKSSGAFSLTVTAVSGDETVLTVGPAEEVAATLEAGTYEITLSLPAGSSSGYLSVNHGVDEYFTSSLLRHENAEPETMSFTLVVNETVDLTFITRWGIRSDDPSVTEGGTLTIGEIVAGE